MTRAPSQMNPVHYIAHTFLNLVAKGMRMEPSRGWVVVYIPKPLQPRGNTRRYELYKRLGWQHRRSESNSERPAISLVTMVTELSLLLFPTTIPSIYSLPFSLSD
jgi:hypothetical protein